MKTKKVAIEVPDTLDEKELKIWVLDKVARHLKSKITPQNLDIITKPDLDIIKDKNGITDDDLR